MLAPSVRYRIDSSLLIRVIWKWVGSRTPANDGDYHKTFVAPYRTRYELVDIRESKAGVTPLQIAVWQNRLEVVRFLVDECVVDRRAQKSNFGCGYTHRKGVAPQIEQVCCFYRRCERLTED